METIRKILKNSAIGSKILVTTRKEKGSKMMGVKSNKIISLQILSRDLYWSVYFVKWLSLIIRTTTRN